jgi:hypothetical protein
MRIETKRKIWFKWMLPSSLIAAGIILADLCSFFGRIGTVDLYLVTAIFGSVFGLFIGFLQWILITRKASVAPDWWVVLLQGPVIWSTSFFIGTFLSMIVGVSFYSSTSSGWGGVVVGLVSFPIIVWIVGMAIQGGIVALYLHFFNDGRQTWYIMRRR